MSKISSVQRVEVFKQWLEWFNKNRPKPRPKVENQISYSKTK